MVKYSGMVIVCIKLMTLISLVMRGWSHTHNLREQLKFNIVLACCVNNGQLVNSLDHIVVKIAYKQKLVIDLRWNC